MKGLSLGLSLSASGSAVSYPELLSNTAFDNSTDLILTNATVSGGQLHLNTGLFDRADQAFTATFGVGEVYRLSLVVSQLGNCSPKIDFGSTGSSASNGTTAITGTGTYDFTIVTGGTSSAWQVRLWNSAAGATECIVDSYSLKRVS